jgi:carbonic anhydrase
MGAERQSPVDIPPTAPIHRDGLELHYGSIPLILGHNPIATQIDCTSEIWMTIEGERYELVQFHLHSPGEHTFSRTHAAMELHLVHQTADGRIGVVAVMFVEGLPNPALEQLVAALDGVEPPAQIDVARLLPSDHAHVAYVGSLTMPPYDEDVAWRVMVRANTMSAAQRVALAAAHHGNNRPVQPLNGRVFE